MHQEGFAHRDLKPVRRGDWGDRNGEGDGDCLPCLSAALTPGAFPVPQENMLFDERRKIKLIDLGLVSMPGEDMTKTSCGSANYAAVRSLGPGDWAT